MMSGKVSGYIPSSNIICSNISSSSSLKLGVRHEVRKTFSGVIFNKKRTEIYF